jgi:hypothetical protein
MPGGMGVSTGPSALEQAAREAAGAPIRTAMLPEPAQLEMLRSGDGKLDHGAIHQARGRGRPAGARNKRQKKIADYFVQRYGDPLDVLGGVMTTPLKQLVEIVREADDAHEREDRLVKLAETIEAEVEKMVGKASLTIKEIQRLNTLVDRLGDIAKVLRATPGKLALDVLSVQIQVTRAALEYVHGKQPISLDVGGKVDLVVFAPEILKQHGIDAGELQSAIAERGLEAFDPENMRLLPPEDADYEEVGE